jgi:hypothetical protein
MTPASVAERQVLREPVRGDDRDFLLDLCFLEG